MTAPVRLPDAASLKAVMAGLDPVSADADLVPALARAFPGFAFRIARIDDDYSLGWVFLMSRGLSVEAGIGQAIAAGLREQRVRLPDDAPGCCAWRSSRTDSDGALPMDDITSARWSPTPKPGGRCSSTRSRRSCRWSGATGSPNS